MAICFKAIVDHPSYAITTALNHWTTLQQPVAHVVWPICTSVLFLICTEYCNARSGEEFVLLGVYESMTNLFTAWPLPYGGEILIGDRYELLSVHVHSNLDLWYAHYQVES